MAGSLPQSGVSLVAQNAGQFISSMRSGESALNSFQRGAGAMSQIVTGALRRVGEMVVDMAARAVKAVGHWLKDSIGVAGDFEQTLNVLGATSGATATELDAVARRAKELGADLTLPATSAGDAAEVMLELSKAGFTVQESMDAAKGALQLAAAAQVDSATAAQITAGAINAFNLEASDAVRIADLLAAGANASSASMTDLSAGLQQAGFMFHAVGMPVEDLVTSLAALTNVGLTGSDAGTALKNALVRLSNPTKKAAGLMAELGFSAYDANGRMKPLPDLIADLNRSLAGMTDEERNSALGTIFLSDGMKAMIPLLGLGKDGFLKLKGAVTEQGAASTVAAAQMKGWNGGIQAVGSQMETLQLIVGTFLKNALTPFLFRLAETISRITTLADRFFTLLPQVQSAAAPFSALMGLFVLLNPSLSGVAYGLLRIVQAVTPMVQALTDGNVSFTDLQGLLTSILGPLGATRGAIATATGAINEIWTAAQRVGAILQGEVPGALATAQGALAAVVNFVLGSVLPALAQATTWFATNLPAGIATAKAAFADVAAFVTTIMPTITSIVAQAVQLIQVIWQKHGQDILFIVTNAWEGIKGLIQIVLGAIQGILAVALGLMTGDWGTAMGTIQASNTTIWNGIRQFLSGILNMIAGLFGTTLDKLVALWASNLRAIDRAIQMVLTIVVSFIRTKLNEILSTVNGVLGAVVAAWNGLFNSARSTVESVMSAAASIVQSKIDSIIGAFNSIKGVIDGVIGKVKSLINTLNNIHVPDILTPGSPTPFELGLRGIASATEAAADSIDKHLAKALSGVATAAPASLSVVQGALGGVTRAADHAAASIKKLLGAASAVGKSGGGLPAWITPGSPTPFEIGLRGIDAAAKQVAATFSGVFGPALTQSLAAAAKPVTDITQALTKLTSAPSKTAKPSTPSKLPKPGSPRAPDWPPRSPSHTTTSGAQTEDMYQAIDRLTREAAAKAATAAVKAATVAAKIVAGPVRQTLAQHMPAVRSARALAPITGQASSQSTDLSRTFNMPIYTNQSPAVLAQSLALIEATTA